MAQKWIGAKRLEGEEFHEPLDVHVYGPFPTMVELEAMLSGEHMAIGFRERAHITLGKGLFNHYLLNAAFRVTHKSRPSWDKGAQEEALHGTQVLQA